MTELERVTQEYLEAEKVFNAERMAAYDEPTVEQFNKAHAKAYKKFSPYVFAFKQVGEPVFEPLPDYGDHMTFEQFKQACESGCFIDYDGSGNYANETQMTDIGISPSDFEDNTYLTNYSHVVWFNR